MGLAETVQRYAVFYLATSFVWDAARLVGNVTLMLAFGAPILRVLRRFHLRFTYDYDPTPASVTERGVQPTYVPAGAERAA
jgi:energy-coupling factor transport system substrate-specific component